MTADPKPAARIVNPDAMKRKLASDLVCRGCHVRRAANCHHLIGKAQSGDDVEANLVPLCGSGSHGCHGALHGNPYVEVGGLRWTAHDVRQNIGMTLHPEEILYLVAKLGRVAAVELLRDRYHVEVTLIPLTGRRL
jgi:hypothetical protein